MAQFVTAEAARERFRALADQVDAAYDEMRALSSAEVGNEFRVELAERLETLGAPPACGGERTNRGRMYRVFEEMADPPDEAAMAPVLVNSLAARLRIPPREVKRRMKVAARIRPRRQLCGPPLVPELELVAAAVEAGTIGEDHLRVISRAIDVLPSAVSVADRDDVEASLVREAPRMTSRSSRPPPAALMRSSIPTAIRRGRPGAPPRCARAGICPTAPWSRWPTTAVRPSAATTASSSR